MATKLLNAATNQGTTHIEEDMPVEANEEDAEPSPRPAQDTQTSTLLKNSNYVFTCFMFFLCSISF